MITKKILQIISILLIMFSNIGCDQISKLVVRKNIEINVQIMVGISLILLDTILKTHKYESKTQL